MTKKRFTQIDDEVWTDNSRKRVCTCDSYFYAELICTVLNEQLNQPRSCINCGEWLRDSPAYYCRVNGSISGDNVDLQNLAQNCDSYWRI